MQARGNRRFPGAALACAALFAAALVGGCAQAPQRGSGDLGLVVERADGRLHAAGALPTLIQWQGPHPADAMPDSGVVLKGLTLNRVPQRSQRYSVMVTSLPSARSSLR